VAYPAALVVLTAIQVVAPQRNGPLALAQVFAPWLFLPLLALLPQAALLRDRALIALLTASALVFAVHLGPGFVPAGRSAPDPAAVPITVASWNVLFRNRADRVARGVRDLDVDVVGLVELTPAQAAALDADPAVRARFGSRVLLPEYGRGLLSRRPVLASGVRADPELGRGSRLLWARLDLGAGRVLTVLVAHPLAPRARWVGPVPASYDTAPRDAQIAFVRSVVDEAVRAGDRVLLLGDFNVTDREPGVAVLVNGLRDAQAELGWGSGASWALPPLRRRGIALVRIDRALGGPGVLPTAVRTDCTWRGSDHCVLLAAFAVAPAGDQPAALSRP
jgi:endonuclease/exonuclease/phosphatase family metal-dependent hydrolase